MKRVIEVHGGGEPSNVAGAGAVLKAKLTRLSDCKRFLFLCKQSRVDTRSVIRYASTLSVEKICKVET